MRVRLYCRVAIVSTFDLPPFQGASLWVAVPGVEALIFVHIPEEEWKLGKRRSMVRKNTGWKPLEFGHFEEVTSGKFLPKKGLENSAQGFNLPSHLGQPCEPVRRTSR